MNANTTQVCKKCKVDKSLTEYHRRGASHQRICKTCRKSHVPSGGKRVIIMNPSSLYPELAMRIESLKGKLRSKAASYASDQMEADDIYAAMVEEILFKSKPEDSDSRILTRATWAAKAVISKYKTYSSLVEDEASMLTKTDDDDMELVASPYQSAEDDFLYRESMSEILEKVALLPKEYQVIISMLTLGYNQREIAHKLQKSDQAISSTIKNIATQLTTLGLSPSLSFA
ncbi:MAG: hypothetical protein PHQ36_07580 [Anaerolineales bacterium]|nr:hypothetical protein [Anaerolineales bacterium]